MGSELMSECSCLYYLESEAMMYTEEGPVCPVQHDYLLLGLEVKEETEMVVLIFLFGAGLNLR